MNATMFIDQKVIQQTRETDATNKRTYIIVIFPDLTSNNDKVWPELKK